VNSLQTVADRAETVLRIKGSKFIAHAETVSNEKDVAIALKRIQSRFPDATHHCYAWRLFPENIREFGQDDGEPSGTAGLPILNKLRSQNLVRTLLVVVRYYGGTKLGKAGLIKAYGDAAAQVLDNLILRPLRAITRFEIQYNYSESGLLENFMKNCDALIILSDYGETITLTIECPAEKAGELAGKLSAIAYLGVQFKELGTKYV
jgi:uncharacterized YigZ family protein